MPRILFVLVLFAGLGALSGGAFGAPAGAIAPVKACESLIGLDLAGVTDKAAHIESAKAAKVQGADVCEVMGTIEPKILFAVRLPLSTWTGRFLEIGCGGLCGHMPDEFAQTYGCAPLENGEFAVALTDMGHEGPGPEFGDDPQLRVDFAYRGLHQTVLAAKAIVAASYGRQADHSYFLGCSDGGREGLVEAERYPADFDGVTAGAPAMNFLIQNTFYHAWNARSNLGADGKPIITAKDLPVLHRAALAACHAVDGVIADPLRCKFDPSVAACKPGETQDCLTPVQVETARKFYEGPHDATGLALTPGGLMPGSELSWAGVFVPKPGEDFIFGQVIADGAIAHLAFALGGKPIGIDDLKFDRETYEKLLPQHPLYDGTKSRHCGLRGSRRQAHLVARRFRPAHFAHQFDFVLRGGEVDDRRSEGEGGRALLPAARRVSMRGWGRAGSDGRADGDRRLGRTRCGARGADSARRERCAAGIPLSSAREVQRLGRPGAGFVVHGRDAGRAVRRAQVDRRGAVRSTREVSPIAQPPYAAIAARTRAIARSDRPADRPLAQPRVQALEERAQGKTRLERGLGRNDRVAFRNPRQAAPQR